MNVNAGAAVKPEQLETTLSDMLIQWYETEEKKFFEAIDDSAEKCNEAAKLNFQNTPGATATAVFQLISKS